MDGAFMRPRCRKVWNKNTRQKTALQNLKKNINGTGKSYSIIYRRKYGEEYKDTMMEILAAEDYTDDSQVCYLCVRCLG